MEKNFKKYKLLIFVFTKYFLITKYSVTKSYDNFKILCDDIPLLTIALQLDNLQCWGSPRYLIH